METLASNSVAVIPVDPDRPIPLDYQTPKAMPPTRLGPIITAATVIAICTGGAGLFVLTGFGTFRTAGASRSAHLKWEQRQEQIELTIVGSMESGKNTEESP